MKARVARSFHLLLLLPVFCCTTNKIHAEQDQVDPLKSPMWQDMRRNLLGDSPVIFDDRVRVLAPGNAEDSMNVPVLVDASALGEVSRLLVFAELNPIHKVLEMEPLQANPLVGFRIKVQQATPVRAAALTPDGTWHVAGRIVEAAGGGCTVPSLGSGDSDWASRMGEVVGRLWPNNDATRLRLRIMHPMDTGLVPGIPAFHIDRLDFLDATGEPLSRLFLYEPVAENPVITLDLPRRDSVTVVGTDNNGNPIEAKIVAGLQEAER
ncbi:MAG: quinoprotein dehydrogenase-associated SoxYZ-like carrier [Candidatus Thiodiazotropha sp.]